MRTTAIETSTCPEHGTQVVTGTGTCGPAHDPSTAETLACGHRVTCLGPGEPNVILGALPARPRVRVRRPRPVCRHFDGCTDPYCPCTCIGCQ